MRLPAGITDKRNAAQLIFHHPLEVTAQVTVNHKDVEYALMIGYEDIALVLFQVFVPLHLDWQQKHFQDDLGPPASWIVAPEMTIANGGAYAHLQRSNDSDDDKYRQPDK